MWYNPSVSKLITLQKAVSLLPDSSMVFLGGSGLHRNPMAFCRELIRQKKRDLHLIGVIGGLAADMLAGGEVLGRAELAEVSIDDTMDALYFRQGVFDRTIATEFYSALAMSLRLYGGRVGVPFLPLRSMLGTDLIVAGMRGDGGKSSLVSCPFSAEPVRLVPSVNPDFSIIHALRADEEGNFELSGPVENDRDGFEAGDVKIITAEEVVKNLSDSTIKRVESHRPGWVRADYVIKAKYGGWPTSVDKAYDSNIENIDEWRDLSFKKYFSAWIKPPETQLAQKIGRKISK